MTPDLKHIEARLSVITKHQQEVSEQLQDYAEMLKEREAKIRKIGTLEGQQAARMLGYRNRNSFYGIVPGLKEKGWFKQGYDLMEVLALAELKKQYRSIKRVPAKSEVNPELLNEEVA